MKSYKRFLRLSRFSDSNSFMTVGPGFGFSTTCNIAFVGIITDVRHAKGN